MHASAFCGGIGVTTMENSTATAVGALIAGAAGAVASIVVPFRRATVEERKEMLQREDLSGLRAICTALRVKKATSKAEKVALVDIIEQTLAYDDVIYQPNSPAGRLAALLSTMPDSNAATDLVVRKFKLKELKQFCSCLRLPLTGRKSDLSRSLVDEMRYTLAAISASTGQKEDVPQAAGAGTSSVAPAAAAVAAAAATESAAVESSAPALASATTLEEVGKTNTVVSVDESRRTRGSSFQCLRDDSLDSRRSRRSSGEVSVRPALELDGAKAEVSQPAVIDVQVTPVERPARAAIGNPVQTLPVGGKLQSGVVQTQAIPDADSRRRERRQRRKIRWEMQKMTYVAEELACAYGGNKENYRRDMRGILDDVPEKTYATNVADLSDTSNGQRPPSPSLGEAANSPLEQMVMLGEIGRSRKAWCKWWDNTKGYGELLDIDDQITVSVASNDLQIAVNVLDQLKYLVPREIVEYRRVEAEGMASRAVLVRGMLGWPLRCEMDS